MESKKKDTDEFIYKTGNKIMVTKREKEGGINWDLGLIDTHCCVNNKDLLYSTENYTQHLMIIYNGKESEE